MNSKENPMLHGQGVHPIDPPAPTTASSLIAEIDRLRVALLLITNLTGGCSLSDAKRIATTALDLEPQAHPAG
jgi:hypothetical protein